jgi:tetratricopeptide (TPR) repeat protein
MSLSRIDSAIRWCFYGLFGIVPLLIFPTTSELFELNKMWMVWGISLIILFLWVSKMIFAKQWLFQRTPLDIPLGLFLLSQLIATLFSMDHSVSMWGYYSRFNGGLLSLISYIFLYYAFASNVLHSDKKHTVRTILVMLLSGAVVALWGFPSHFGYDPTCLMFRGTLDVSCWTEAFQPKVRIFSTLGQPNWLAAYLSILVPISIAFGINTLFSNYLPSGKVKLKTLISRFKESVPKKSLLLSSLFILLTIIFYIDIIWTDSQSGFLGLWGGLGIFFMATIAYQIKRSSVRVITQSYVPILGLLLLVLLGLSIYLGTPIERLKNLSFSPSTNSAPTQDTTVEQSAPALPALEFGGTDSSKIRLIVWEGAVNIFKSNPIFGSGVETFAYSYYQHRPAAHNLTSEWDYLYNKAHNEYLNYLATTGIFGLGTYLLFIGWVVYLYVKYLWNFYFQKNKKTELEEKYESLNYILATALFSGWVSILISNFFGFSVVILNLLLFIFPLWIIHLTQFSSTDMSKKINSFIHTPQRKTLVFSLGIIILVFEIVLFRYWLADKAYGMGNNLNKMGEYVTANQYLVDAVQKRPGEDLFKDELAVNVSTLALVLDQQGQSTQAAQFAQQAQFLSDNIVNKHPNNVVYWKSRTRIMYSLAQLDPSLFTLAIQAIEKASDLAPTDAKVAYNKALLYEQAGQRDEALKILTEAIALKPNYRDALYAKALLHTEIADAIEATNSAQATQERSEARKHLELIINYIVPTDTQSQELLEKLN